MKIEYNTFMADGYLHGPGTKKLLKQFDVAALQQILVHNGIKQEYDEKFLRERVFAVACLCYTLGKLKLMTPEDSEFVPTREMKQEIIDRDNAFAVNWFADVLIKLELVKDYSIATHTRKYARLTNPHEIVKIGQLLHVYNRLEKL